MIEEQVLFKQENNTHNKDIEILKQHFPNCFDKNGDFLLQNFNEILKKSDTQTTKEYYYLNWLGKSYARLLRNLSPETLIIEDKTHNEKEENKNSKNLLIKGDNLEVLKHLKNAYSQKIKMIYIDPPYNTGSDGFVYQDDRKFTKEHLSKLANIDIEEAERVLSFTNKESNSHSAWLTFMYPRLYIARDLLKDDGVIFISIDDNEMANLKLLCDEIFGEENFLYKLSVVNKLNGNDNSSGMMETQEYCYIYAKNSEKFQFGVLPIDDEKEIDKWEEDELGFWKEGGSLKATGENAPREKRPNLFFPIYLDEKNNTFSLEKDNNHTFELLPITDNQEMSWYWDKNKFLKDKDEVIVKKTSNGYSLYKKQRPALGDLPSKRGKTTFYSPRYSTANSNKDIKNLFNGKSVFNYSKPKYFIQDLIYLANTNPNDIILDFFAGSGTTAHAVMDLNAENGGNRKFILVQLDEEIDSKKSKKAYDFVKNELNSPKPSIFDIAKERIIRASKKIKEEHKNLSMQDFGFKIYQTCENFCLKIEDIALDKAVLPLFDNFDEEKYQTLLTSWRLYDGEQLTSEIKEIKLANYTAYLCSKNLYLLYPDFESKNIISLIKMLDEDKDFSPNRVIFYGENIDSSKQKELNQALESYANKKNLTINLLARY